MKPELEQEGSAQEHLEQDELFEHHRIVVDNGQEQVRID